MKCMIDRFFDRYGRYLDQVDRENDQQIGFNYQYFVILTAI